MKEKIGCAEVNVDTSELLICIYAQGKMRNSCFSLACISIKLKYETGNLEKKRIWRRNIKEWHGEIALMRWFKFAKEIEEKREREKVYFVKILKEHIIIAYTGKMLKWKFIFLCIRTSCSHRLQEHGFIYQNYFLEIQRKSFDKNWKAAIRIFLEILKHVKCVPRKENSL